MTVGAVAFSLIFRLKAPRKIIHLIDEKRSKIADGFSSSEILYLLLFVWPQAVSRQGKLPVFLGSLLDLLCLPS